MKKLFHNKKEDNFLDFSNSHTGEENCTGCNGEVNPKCVLTFKLHKVDKKDLRNTFQRIRVQKEYIDNNTIFLNLSMLRDETNKLLEMIRDFRIKGTIFNNTIYNQFNNPELICVLTSEINDWCFVIRKIEEEVFKWKKNDQKVVLIWTRLNHSDLIPLICGGIIVIIIFIFCIIFFL